MKKSKKDWRFVNFGPFSISTAGRIRRKLEEGKGLGKDKSMPKTYSRIKKAYRRRFLGLVIYSNKYNPEDK